MKGGRGACALIFSPDSGRHAVGLPRRRTLWIMCRARFSEGKGRWAGLAQLWVRLLFVGGGMAVVLVHPLRMYPPFMHPPRPPCAVVLHAVAGGGPSAFNPTRPPQPTPMGEFFRSVFLCCCIACKAGQRLEQGAGLEAPASRLPRAATPGSCPASGRVRVPCAHGRLQMWSLHAPSHSLWCTRWLWNWVAKIVRDEVSRNGI